MRPLARPAWDSRWAEGDAGVAVALAMGSYCSACERPLQRSPLAWSAATGAIVATVESASEWRELLPVCEHCATAASCLSPPEWGAPLLPDRDRTFGLGEAAPFAYEPRTLELTAPAIGVRSAHEVSRVAVVPSGERAADTVRLFRLNQAVIPPRVAAEFSEEPIAVPDEIAIAQVEFYDPRLILRTESWRNAHQAADLLERAPMPRERVELAQVVAHEVLAEGQWSVWASVLWERLHDPDLIRSIFVPAAPVPEEAAPTPYIPLARSARVLAATRDDWLGEAAGGESAG